MKPQGKVVTMKNRIMENSIVAAVLVMSIQIAVFAQQTPDLTSPEIRSDGTITFYYKNDRAGEVLLEGTMSIFAGAVGPMMKNTEGVWTRTVSGLEPGVYHYTFRVDGSPVVDPLNPHLRKGLIRGQSSVLIVPAMPPRPWEERSDIPHGSVVEEKFFSRVLQEQKSCYVYLPPGYHDSAESYSIFYLLHGAGDHAAAWITDGFADNIMDALIAGKKISPMIGVFPDGSVMMGPSVARRDPAVRVKRSKLHEEYFLTEVMPLIETRYRVRNDGRHRAIAGLSMGASQTFQLAFRHPHLFSAVGPFSNGADLDAENPYNLISVIRENKEAINSYIGAMYIVIGTDDFLLERARNTVAFLKDAGIRHEYRELPGAHNWKFWMERVTEFLPMFCGELKDN